MEPNAPSKCSCPDCANDLPEGRPKYCSKKCVSKAWYLANQERAKAQAKAWRMANPERVRNNKRTWHSANRDKDNARHTAWNKANRKKMRETLKKWRIKTAVRRKAQRNAHIENIYSKLQTLFGPACIDCKQIYPMAIYHYHHLDPSNKEGRLQIGKWSWLRIEAYVFNTVQLCPNCHALRHYIERKGGTLNAC